MGKKKLFVLMPFGDGHDSPLSCNFDQWYNSILRPAGEEAGFDVKRADQELLSGSIMEQVWEDLQSTDVVLAFLTGRNPNVFYELGLAHTLLKPVLLVADKREKLPFDVTHLRHYLYEDSNVDRVGIFKPEIRQRLQAIAAAPERAVLQLFSKRGTRL